MATIASPRTQSPAPLQHIASPSLASTSAAGTPVSSNRPSIDLPSPSPNFNGSQPNQPNSQRRNRAALRDYYNLKSKPASLQSQKLSRSDSNASHVSDSTVTTTVSASGGPTPQPTSSSILPPEIDSSTFEPEAYVSDLLHAASLRDILKNESALVSEIRILDGERKALVYDNYSKLIRAVGTIGNMQRGMSTDVGGLGVREDGINPPVGSVAGQDRPGEGVHAIQGLDQNLERLTGLLQRINGTQLKTEHGTKSRPSHEARLQRREERNKRRAVTWILDSPGRLQSMKDEGRDAEAEEEWQQVQKLLSKCSVAQRTNEIRRACEAVMGGEGNEMTEADVG